MRPKDLVLRCFAENQGDVWVAFCIDLNLGVQDESFDSVKIRLESVIKSYLYDAFEGDEREHLADLFPRRAPLALRLRYHKIVLRNRFLGMVARALNRRARDRRATDSTVFNDVMPIKICAAMP
jgi:hypothetical protein